MPLIEARVKDLPDETCLVMLGAQILLGLQYRVAFSSGLRRLPISFQTLDCVALLLILETVGLLLATPSFRGAMPPRASSHVRLAQCWRRLALALGIDAVIGPVGYAGSWSAGLAGGTFVLLAILGWHVVSICAATRRERKDDPMKNRQQSLEAASFSR